MDTTIPEGVSTLMIQCVPHSYSSDALLFEINSHCSLESCDMLYLPQIANRMSNIGYAFINFSITEDAQKCASVLSGHRWTLVQKKKCCIVAPARVQGLSENLAQFVRSSKEDRLQLGCTPMVFSEGRRISLTDAVKAFCDASVYQELQKKCVTHIPEALRAKPKTVLSNRSCASADKIFCGDVGDWGLISRDVRLGTKGDTETELGPGTDEEQKLCSGFSPDQRAEAPWPQGLVSLSHWAQQDEPHEVHFLRFSL
jgi:hypothetical protein